MLLEQQESSFLKKLINSITPLSLTLLTSERLQIRLFVLTQPHKLSLIHSLRIFSNYVAEKIAHCFTTRSSGWWRNMTTGAPAYLTIKGERWQSIPDVAAEDNEFKLAQLDAFLQAVPRDASHAGVALDNRGNLDFDDMRQVGAQHGLSSISVATDSLLYGFSGANRRMPSDKSSEPAIIHSVSIPPNFALSRANIVIAAIFVVADKEVFFGDVNPA